MGGRKQQQGAKSAETVGRQRPVLRRFVKICWSRAHGSQHAHSTRRALCGFYKLATRCHGQRGCQLARNETRDSASDHAGLPRRTLRFLPIAQGAEANSTGGRDSGFGPRCASLRASGTSANRKAVDSNRLTTTAERKGEPLGGLKDRATRPFHPRLSARLATCLGWQTDRPTNKEAPISRLWAGGAMPILFRPAVPSRWKMGTTLRRPPCSRSSQQSRGSDRLPCTCG